MIMKHSKTIIAVLAGISLLSLGALSGILLSGNKTPDALPASSSAAPSGEATAIQAQFQPAIPPANRSVLAAYQEAFRAVSQATLPTVVLVETASTKPRPAPQLLMPFFNFPGQPQPPQEDDRGGGERTIGFGSGVIVQKRGNDYFILTNNHVIADGDRFKVRLSDNTSLDASLVGADAKRDIAVLKVTTITALSQARLGDSATVRAGDIVFAVGSPYGIQNTITQGIISATNRTSSDFRGGAGVESNFTDYLQTDAAINQGNSGGALVNIDGEVVGINTWIASRTGGNVGLGFAVPINNARKVMNDIIEKGKAEYAWLGVSSLDLGDADRKALDLQGKNGAFVAAIVRDSPAGRAGIRPGDLITRFADTPLSNGGELVRAVSSKDPDKNYSVEVIRDGKPRSFTVRLGVRDDEKLQKSGTWPGLTVTGLTEAMQKRQKGTVALGMPTVARVEEGSAAAEVGIGELDVVTSINGQSVKNLKDFYRVLATVDGSSLELGLINRNGREVTVRFAP